ncbi:MAG: GntR family transcriptional regulator [Deltaproteobacteria bacterium]|nr:GntR family transcriptional regulator [Deltaproteobacteria bacterium]
MVSVNGPVENNGPLDLRSLRSQIYEYIRDEIQTGQLIPGSFIKMREISKHLGVSITPLRDAIIQLECEGFVTILPRRGILLNKMTLPEIKNSLEIVGALESTVIKSVFDRITMLHLKKMERLNAQMRELLQVENFDHSFNERFYQLNFDFHNVFLNLSSNQSLIRIVIPVKQRLYDLQQLAYIRRWELINCDEHEQLIQYIEAGERAKAVRLWRDSHWSFKAHEKFIREFYSQGNRQIRKQLDNQR